MPSHRSVIGLTIQEMARTFQVLHINKAVEARRLASFQLRAPVIAALDIVLELCIVVVTRRCSIRLYRIVQRSRVSLIATFEVV